MIFRDGETFLRVSDTGIRFSKGGGGCSPSPARSLPETVACSTPAVEILRQKLPDYISKYLHHRRVRSFRLSNAVWVAAACTADADRYRGMFRAGIPAWRMIIALVQSRYMFPQLRGSIDHQLCAAMGRIELLPGIGRHWHG